MPITTERLIIRPFTEGDLGAIHALWSDPQVMGAVPSQPRDRKRSRARLKENIAHHARHGFSKWAVTDKASGHVIGECGLQYLEDSPDIELGYKILRTRWGQGLATEAAQACLRWALAERPEQVVAIVDAANTRSARVLSKIGMVRDGTIVRYGHEWDLYRALRPQARTGGAGCSRQER